MVINSPAVLLPPKWLGRGSIRSLSHADANQAVRGREKVRTLINELCCIPDVFPISFQPQTLDSWDESQVDRLWSAPAVNGYSAQCPTVEILHIRWDLQKG